MQIDYGVVRCETILIEFPFTFSYIAYFMTFALSVRQSIALEIIVHHTNAKRVQDETPAVDTRKSEKGIVRPEPKKEAKSQMGEKIKQRGMPAPTSHLKEKSILLASQPGQDEKERNSSKTNRDFELPVHLLARSGGHWT